MATVGYGIILVNTTNGHVELLTNPDGLQRNRPELDGPFGFAQVGELGPISKHPGSGGKIFVFADRLLRNLRVMDLSTRRFYSLCAPGTKDFITRYSTEPTPALQISGGQMPICMLSVPHTVLVTQSSQALLVSQSDRLENLYIKCKYSTHTKAPNVGNSLYYLPHKKHRPPAGLAPTRDVNDWR